MNVEIIRKNSAAELLQKDDQTGLILFFQEHPRISLEEFTTWVQRHCNTGTFPKNYLNIIEATYNKAHSSKS